MEKFILKKLAQLRLERNIVSKVRLINESRQKNKEGKDKKRESAYAICEGPKLTLKDFKSVRFSIKETKGKRLKILTPKHMLQRLQIALAQVKTGITSGRNHSKVYENNNEFNKAITQKRVIYL